MSLFGHSTGTSPLPPLGVDSVAQKCELRGMGQKQLACWPPPPSPSSLLSLPFASLHSTCCPLVGKKSKKVLENFSLFLPMITEGGFKFFSKGQYSPFSMFQLPAAFIFTLHLLIATGIVPNTSNTYRVLNVTLIIRSVHPNSKSFISKKHFSNLLIVLTSPLQFGIYCSMVPSSIHFPNFNIPPHFQSEQFRLTVRQLFSSRPLFVAQAQPSNYHGAKRYYFGPQIYLSFFSDIPSFWWMFVGHQLLPHPQ
jgi:hypothetical protein